MSIMRANRISMKDIYKRRIEASKQYDEYLKSIGCPKLRGCGSLLGSR